MAPERWDRRLDRAARIRSFRSVVGVVDAHYNLGHAYELSDDWQQAHSEYQKALALDPGHQLAFEGVKRLETPEEIR